MSFDPEQFQGEVMVWNLKNFDKHDPTQPLIGIVEEIGELFEAFDEQDKDGAQDACGDIMVFLAYYCGMNGLQLMQCVSKHQAPSSWRAMSATSVLEQLPKTLGHLAHAHLKMSQGIRNNEDHNNTKMNSVGAIVALLKVLMEYQSDDLTDVVGRIWGEVKMRDWKRWPKTGVDPDPFIDPAPIDEVRQWSHESGKIANKLDKLIPHRSFPHKTTWSVKHQPAAALKPAKPSKNPCGDKGFKMPEKKNWSKEVSF